MASSDLAGIAADLSVEHDELFSLVASLDHDAWDLPTPAQGWEVRDQVSHLAFFDEIAALAVSDPAAFTVVADRANRALSSGEDPMQPHLAKGREMTPGQLLAWWEQSYGGLTDAVRDADPALRVPWFGPPMSISSFLSARMMETWAHGEDIADALGVERQPTDRLRHIAHLGVAARGFSYVVHSMDPPSHPVRVSLVAPSGGSWTWGPEDAVSSVEGIAIEFCLVVTRRRRLSSTGLVLNGDDAVAWMEIAQAFAGPPGPTRQA